MRQLGIWVAAFWEYTPGKRQSVLLKTHLLRSQTPSQSPLQDNRREKPYHTLKSCRQNTTPVFEQECIYPCCCTTRNTLAVQSPTATVDRALEMSFTNSCEGFAWWNEECLKCLPRHTNPKSDCNPPNERSLAKTACHPSVSITNRCWRSAASSHT